MLRSYTALSSWPDLNVAWTLSGRRRRRRTSVKSVAKGRAGSTVTLPRSSVDGRWTELRDHPSIPWSPPSRALLRGRCVRTRRDAGRIAKGRIQAPKLRLSTVRIARDHPPAIGFPDLPQIIWRRPQASLTGAGAGVADREMHRMTPAKGINHWKNTKYIRCDRRTGSQGECPVMTGPGKLHSVHVPFLSR